MVSNDTESRTIDYLEKNNYFGMKKEHISIVKQENVPALLDNHGNMATTTEGGALRIVTKPHGHGDIHALLY
jgi:UDP-sugar pyrophosphorylase